jgi:hypothetical protein
VIEIYEEAFNRSQDLVSSPSSTKVAVTRRLSWLTNRNTFSSPADSLAGCVTFNLLSSTPSKHQLPLRSKLPD